MSHSVEFLLRHGYAILFLAVLAEQIGLPFPSSPLLLAAGALVGMHLFNPAVVLFVAVSASLLSDSVWFDLGRDRGNEILGHVCRVSLEPETCVSKMHSAYFRYGAKSLLFCKFVPGLGTLGPPMAGMMKLAPWRFLALDAAGALSWSGAYVALGWMFQAQLEALAAGMATFGIWLAIALASIIFFYASWKYIKRRRFYRSLRIAQITPYELRQRMDAGEKLIVIDLRDPSEWREGRIPGSLQFEQSQLDKMIPAIAQAEAVLYCSCRNEADGARAALRLKHRGVRRVRPLEGGFERWLELGFPVEQYGRLSAGV
jgi:membrane protein DedA with SNARE-associated domain/rhodanese-related sulfurtransferase